MIASDRVLALLEARYDIARDAWELAFVACARGDFQEAIGFATPLLNHPDPAVRAQARLTAGSALRQLGRYDQARGVERVHDIDDPLSRAHLFISQAANAVGVGSVRVARAALGTALTLIEEGASGIEERRARIRASWVDAEIAFAEDQPAVALGALSPARALSAGWPRHEAKSALFRGVAHHLTDDPETAERSLRDAKQLAESIGADPIARVAAELRSRIADSSSPRARGIDGP